MKPYSASPFPEVGDVPPTPEWHKRAALEQLALAYGGGACTRAEFDEWGQMLGLLEHAPDTPDTPVRLRAVPTDWKREGARAS